MKIRAITCGMSLSPVDFLDVNVDGNLTLGIRFDLIRSYLDKAESALVKLGHEVQTVRISTNSFENWLVPLVEKHGYSVEQVVLALSEQLKRIGIQFCSIGPCSSDSAIALLPTILLIGDMLSSSVLFKKEDNVAPDSEKAILAAKSCLEIVDKCGVLGNFRFCASFNCHAGTPFFPASYHEDSVPPSISIGLESGDLLFMAFFGADTHNEGSANLHDLLKQIALSVQGAMQALCDELDIFYGGIDASINPGLSLPDSAGAGLESLILPKPARTLLAAAQENRPFGSMGTLAAVSAVTRAVQSLPASGVKLVGYNGLMLPVMEDLILASRAAEEPPCFSLRDLLTFSSVCGVGLDTVPVPGDMTAEQLAGVYMEVGALSFRLNKPLTCRVLPMPGQKAGEWTDVTSPYLCNTRVFKVF